MEKEAEKYFELWFRRLLLSSVMDKHLQPDHPLGTCLYRDVMRDKKVKEAIKDGWERIIINGETS